MATRLHRSPLLTKTERERMAMLSKLDDATYYEWLDRFVRAQSDPTLSLPGNNERLVVTDHFIPMEYGGRELVSRLSATDRRKLRDYRCLELLEAERMLAARDQVLGNAHAERELYSGRRSGPVGDFVRNRVRPLLSKLIKRGKID